LPKRWQTFDILRGLFPKAAIPNEQRVPFKALHKHGSEKGMMHEIVNKINRHSVAAMKDICKIFKSQSPVHRYGILMVA
jgi:hypothetical protein